MPFSFLQQKVNLADYARELTLSTYAPQIALDGLVRGVDNVRHDVFLSPKFTEAARLQLFRLVAKYGNVEDIAAEDADPARPPSMFRKPGDSQKIHAYKVGDPAEFKRMLVEIQVAGLNRAKSDGSISKDRASRMPPKRTPCATASRNFRSRRRPCCAKWGKTCLRHCARSKNN